MKKIALLTFASLYILSFSSYAQITKGTVLLGGGISGGKSKSESTPPFAETSSFAIYPAIGLAVKDNAVVGLRFSYSHNKLEQTNAPYVTNQKQNGFGAGVFYRRYASLGKRFYLFGEGNVYYAHSRSTSVFDASTQKASSNINTYGLSFYPGIAFAVSHKIHLEVGLNDLLDFTYSSSKTENSYSGSTTTFSKASDLAFSTNVSTSSPLSVGFRFVLGK